MVQVRVLDISAVAGDGGVLSFTINNNGTGYTKPQIQVSSPSYSNLSVTGVSRRGIGNTTDTGNGASITIDVGAASLLLVLDQLYSQLRILN